MEYIKIFLQNYKIRLFQTNYYLNIYINDEKDNKKNSFKFKPIQIRFKESFKEHFSNFECLIKEIKEKNITINIEEFFDKDKKYIKYLEFKLLKNDVNESKEIISKKIYALNIQYYLTKGSNHKRMNSFPFLTYIKKDYINIGDVINLIEEEDFYKIYNVDIYKYYNNELGSFIDINDEEIKIKGKLILEFHISERKNIFYIYLTQIKNYFYEQITKMKKVTNKYLDVMTNYDLIFLYASPIIKNENYEEFHAPISYLKEIRKILQIINKNKKKLICKFECADNKIFQEVLTNNKTKILHISAHGFYDGNYSLVFENLEKNGQQYLLNINKLKNILSLNKEKISQIDLIIVSTCYSQDLGELFTELGAKNVIYILQKTEIVEDISIYFTKFFYENLLKGKTIKQSFDAAIEEMESNKKVLEINFKSCCCNHYHKPNCLLSEKKNKDILHNKHNKEQCHCIYPKFSKPNYHSKDCKYYRNFIKFIENNYNKNNFIINEEEKKMNKICCCDLSIEHSEISKIKLKSKLNIFNSISPFQKIAQGKVFINSKISFYYNKEKYESIIGRKGLMGRIFQNITEKGKYTILFGEKNLGIKDFAESLCVYLYERKKIKSYEIFSIYSEVDYKYMESKLNKKNIDINYSLNKKVEIIKFDNENDIINYEYFIQIYQKYLIYNIESDFYFIFIFDTIEEKQVKEEEKINNYLFYFEKIIKDIEIKNKKKSKFNLNEEKEKIFYAGFKLTESNKEENKNLKKNEKDIILIKEKDKSYPLYFLLFNLPSGAPDCLLKLIFDNYYSFKDENRYLAKSKIDNWRIINNKRKFKENFKENKNIEICYEYIFKTLKIYTIILYFKIKKKQKNINRKGGIIHYIYNAFSYNEIWKCKIQNIYDKSLNNKIGNEDFNIYKHKQNIIYIISFVINSIKLFRQMEEKKEIFRQINNYIESILLLFPSYFFIDKDNIEILQICIDFCKQLNKNSNHRQNNLLQKLLLFLYSLDENKNEILNILKNENSTIDIKLKEEILFLKVIRNKDNDKIIDELKELLNTNTSEVMKINIYHEIAKEYLKSKECNYSLNYLNKILKMKNLTDFMGYRILLDFFFVFIKVIKNLKNKDKNNLYIAIKQKIRLVNKMIKMPIQKDMYYESQNLKKEIYNLLQPDIIMLNSNSLKQLSEYVYPLNNQYYILNELNKSINSHIRIKTNILNENNLKEALNDKGEILIIQSDDYAKNNNIICESEKGESYLLPFEDIIKTIKTKKINYKIIILCFPNSSSLKLYIDNNQILYNYLISFEYIDFSNNNNAIKYNERFIKFIMDFIKNSIYYNDNDIQNIFEITKKKFINNTNDIKYEKDILKNIILTKKSTENIKIEYNKEIEDKKIFIYDKIHRFNNFDNDFIIYNNYKYYSYKIYELIEEIKYMNKKIYYCDKPNKNIILKICIEAMKFYHRHKTYHDLYYIDIEKGDREFLKSIVKKINETFIEDYEEDKNKEKENIIQQKNYFFLINNCNLNDLLDINIYSILKSNSSFIIIYDIENKKNNNNQMEVKRKERTIKREILLSYADIGEQKKLNYFFNRYGYDNLEIIDNDFINLNILSKDENKSDKFNLKNIKSYLINKKFGIFKKGNLYQYIKQNKIMNKNDISFLFEEKEVKFIFYKILKIVQNLHKKKLYNLNIQLSNIMLDEKFNPILVIFGTSKKCGQKLNYSDIIINEYSPPEFYSENLKYNEFKIDIFNLGILLYILVFGSYPFDLPLNKDKFYDSIKKSENSFSQLYMKQTKLRNITEELENLFINLVSYNPNDRYSIEDILNDNWMKEITTAFNEKSEILNKIEKKILNKLEKINKEKNNKVFNIKNIKNKNNKHYFELKIQPENINPYFIYYNVIHINLFITPNELMNELCKFFEKISQILNIETKKDKYEIIITERNNNKLNEYNFLDTQYSIKLSKNSNNYYYFLNVNYINGNLDIFYERFEELKNYLEILSNKKNIIKIIYQNENNSEINLFGEEFVYNNRNKCKIIYNNNIYELKPKIKFKKNEQLILKLKIISNLTNMEKMFYNCSNVILLPDIHLIDTSHVTNMSYLFSDCQSLNSLPDLSKWDTSNVTNISHLYSNCQSLSSLPDISNWNISHVTNMNSLFSNCQSLLSLPDLSKWNTSNVTDMSYIFFNCKSASLPDISNWDTSKVTDISELFVFCSSSTASIPDISKWNTSNVINMKGLFNNCLFLKEIPDISKWNTSNVKNMNFVFCNCKSLISLPDISKWNTKNVINISSLFYECNSLLSLPDISKWNTNNVIDMNSLFSNCKSLISLPDISKWNTNNTSDINSLFSNCLSLLSLPDISKWITDKITDMKYIFYNCRSLLILPNISYWNTSNVKNMSFMFAECRQLLFLPNISIWNTTNVINMRSLFFNCRCLSLLPDISIWNTNNVKDMNSLFENCQSLSFLPDLSKWNINKEIYMEGMFNKCSSLSSLPDIKWNNIKTIYIDDAFNECLSNLYIPDVFKYKIKTKEENKKSDKK